jgi:multidrug efflux pump subunit AcrA (membrane-fusion protein)
VITVADQAALGTLDEAPVDVTLVADRRENVLTVPVGALVALLEGGYGVLVVDGGTTRYVAVETGMFAGGRVEVSGPAIAEGMTVGVPK